MSASGPDLPAAQAELKPRRSWRLVWALPLLAVLLMTWLLNDAWRQRGEHITVRFQHGHGIKTNDALRYRGIAVGQVRQVQLSDDGSGVEIGLTLTSAAAGLARAGSRFWIVRPQFDLSGARGLDTVVGARYLEVLPGQGEHQRDFIGLEQPPVALIEPGGLEIVLSMPGKGHLRVGAPLSYRQVVIGTVTQVDLARDASAVHANAYIYPEYVNLIRQNTTFWRVGGARVEAGLRGLSLDLNSVSALVLGGINLAIPPSPGRRVAQGTIFRLHDEPEAQWLEWVPGLALEDRAVEHPKLVPARLHWRDRTWYYWPRKRQRRVWLLPLAEGLVGPADVFAALSDGAQLTVNGELLTTPEVRPYAPGLALLPGEHAYPVWSKSLRSIGADSAEDSLIVAGAELPARYVDQARFSKNETGDYWRIDPAVPLNADWHGAAVVAASDGALLGILLVDDAGLRIAPLATAPSGS